MKLKIILTSDSFSASASIGEYSVIVLFYADSFKEHHHQKTFFCKPFPKCHQHNSAFKSTHWIQNKLKHSCGHYRLSCEKSEKGRSLFPDSSLVVVEREKMSTKILAVWKYQPAYKQMATPHGIPSSPGMLHEVLNLFQYSPEQAVLLAKVRKVRNGTEPICAYKSSKFITLN